MFCGKRVIDVSEEGVNAFWVDFSNSSTPPHENSLVHGLVVQYARTPLEERELVEYRFPLCTRGQNTFYLTIRCGVFGISKFPQNFDQSEIDQLMNDRNMILDLNEIKKRVN